MDLLEKEMQIRASTGIAYGYIDTPPQETQPPRFDIVALADLVDSDNVLTAAFDATVDVVTMNGYSFYGDDATEIEKAYKVFNDELDFDQVLDNIIYQLLRSDAFLEIVDAPGKEVPFEVHPLESREMEIRFDEHGQVIGYVQKPKAEGKMDVEFPVDKVIHFRNKWVGSNPYSQNPYRSIERALNVKRAGLIYLQSIFENFPPKLMYTLENANKDQSAAFSAQLRMAKIEPSRDIVAWGKADVKQTGLNLFQTGLTEVLEYLRREIAMLTRIPPSWVGIREGGGRGQGEIETLSFFSRIKKIHQKVESVVNAQLMKKLGFEKTYFKFNAVSMTDETKTMEVAERMRNMQLDDDTVLQYMKDKGMPIRNEASFKKLEQSMESGPVKNKDLMPSRVRKDRMVDGVTNNLNEYGTSDESKAKMESQEMRSAYWTYDGVGQHD
jgi:hypothetical protein